MRLDQDTIVFEDIPINDWDGCELYLFPVAFPSPNGGCKMAKGKVYLISVKVRWTFNDWIDPGISVRAFWQNTYYMTASAYIDGEGPFSLELPTGGYMLYLPDDWQTHGGYEQAWMLPHNLDEGYHTFRLHVQVFAVYEYYFYYPLPGYFVDVLCFMVAESGDVTCEIYAGLPECAFGYDPHSGEAPLTVTFWDETVSPVPLTKSDWDFGDGASASGLTAQHIYTTEGTYKVTHYVENEYGNDSCTHLVYVEAGAVNPRFVASECYCPGPLGVDESFDPSLLIENIGDAGNIWVEYNIAGKTVRVIDSVYISAYGQYEPAIGSHDITWYLGYTPTHSQGLMLTWRTGPVGGGVVGTWPCEIALYVDGDGDEKPKVTNILLLAGSALGIIGGGLLLLSGRGKHGR